MLTLALTGGIGSGKSEAVKQFAKLGVPVVDTDVIAHQLTAIGEPILTEITRIFGADFLTETGALNRAKLRTHIFENPTERMKLEALLHPAIYTHTLSALAENTQTKNTAYQLLVIPLLFESHRYRGVADKTLVIDCDEQLQIQRAMARSQLTETEVVAMMHTQVDRATRLRLANYVIENNGSLAELREKVTDFHKKFIKTCIVSQ